MASLFIFLVRRLHGSIFVANLAFVLGWVNTIQNGCSKGWRVAGVMEYCRKYLMLVLFRSFVLLTLISL